METLLEGLVGNPTRRVSELPLLSSAERRQLLVTNNNTSTESPLDGCLHELIAAQAARTPAAIAVVAGDRALTYATLEQRANRLAQHLRTVGVGSETRVGVCFDRSLNLVVTFLAVLKAGGVYVPLDPSYPPDRLAFMLAGCRRTPS